MGLSWGVTGSTEVKKYRHGLLAFLLGFTMVRCFTAVCFFFPYVL